MALPLAACERRRNDGDCTRQMNLKPEDGP